MWGNEWFLGKRDEISKKVMPFLVLDLEKASFFKKIGSEIQNFGFFEKREKRDVGFPSLKNIFWKKMFCMRTCQNDRKVISRSKATRIEISRVWEV